MKKYLPLILLILTVVLHSCVFKSDDKRSLIKIFLQPGANVDTANAQVTASAQSVVRMMPSGTTPPLVMDYDASTVPILQLSLSGEGMSEQQLNDASQSLVRPQLITVPGAVVPNPYGGKQRQIMINMDQGLLQEKGVAATDVLNSVNAQNIVLPSGTVKIGTREYDVRTNAAVRSVPLERVLFNLGRTLLP